MSEMIWLQNRSALNMIVALARAMKRVIPQTSWQHGAGGA